MNKQEYNQAVRRNLEDIKRYTEIFDTTRERLTVAHEERVRIYHEGWAE